MKILISSALVKITFYAETTKISYRWLSSLIKFLTVGYLCDIF